MKVGIILGFSLCSSSTPDFEGKKKPCRLHIGDAK